MGRLQLIGVSKRIGTTQVADRVNLELADGEIVALLGPSGCGKTTLLRLIAGLSRPDQGTIRYDGHDMAAVPPHERGFRMMFQEFALFPHRSVAQNVAFGLEIQKAPAHLIDARVAEMLALVGLEGYGARDVEALSGGERQRVALARSLAATPRLLMLDEPLGALDRGLRQRLLLDLAQILRRIRVSTLFVTHDQQEAFGVADRIAVMAAGRILQVDRPEALYQAPVSATVARFLGLTNLIAGEASGPNEVATDIGNFSIATSGPLPPGPLTLLMRPEAAQLVSQTEAAGPRTGTISGRVTARLFQGNAYRVAFSVSAGIDLSFTLPVQPMPPGNGERIHLRLDPQAMVVLTSRGADPSP